MDVSAVGLTLHIHYIPPRTGQTMLAPCSADSVLGDLVGNLHHCNGMKPLGATMTVLFTKDRFENNSQA